MRTLAEGSFDLLAEYNIVAAETKERFLTTAAVNLIMSEQTTLDHIALVTGQVGISGASSLHSSAGTVMKSSPRLGIHRRWRQRRNQSNER